MTPSMATLTPTIRHTVRLHHRTISMITQTTPVETHLASVTDKLSGDTKPSIAMR